MGKGCIQISIPAGRVSSDLTNFPVYVKLTNSAGTSSSDLTSIFTALGEDNLKLGVFLPDYTTQCYVEIVSWDTGTSASELHFKAPNIYSASDNMFYLIYDSEMADNSTYVGITGSTPAKAVWSNGYVTVLHMNDVGSNIVDSTSYANVGTKVGGTPSVESPGFVGRAQLFNGTDQCITIPHVTSLNLSSGTLETILNAGNVGTDGYLVSKGNPGAGYYYNNRFVGSSNVTEWAAPSAVQSDAVFTEANTWILSSLTFSDTAVTFYKNGTAAGARTLSTSPQNNTDSLYIGNRLGGATASHFFDGYLDEIRVSNVARSDGWINATYKTLYDTLCTYSQYTWKRVVVETDLAAHSAEETVVHGLRETGMGAAQISASGTSVVVTHGLSTTPTYIYISMVSNPGTSVYFWADTATSTQFTINTSGAVTNNTDFNWIAIV